MKIIDDKNGSLVFYYYDLENPIKKPIFEYFSVKQANFYDFLISYFFDNPHLNFLQRIKRADKFFIVKKKNRILSAGRICFKNTKEILLDKREASLISFFTVKRHRRKGMYSALILEMMHYLQHQGYSKCFIWTDKDNIASISAIEKLKFIRMV